jgi:F0F1-type ATP synthase alpha subunit
MRTIVTPLALAIVLLAIALSVYAAPIQRFQGTILEVGEGFLIVTPDDKSSSKKFLLRWKAHFVPPKLPLKGDHVLILYKDKEEGAVIYQLNYLNAAPESREL